MGSNFPLGNFVMLHFLNLAELPVGASAELPVLICGSVGPVNGPLGGHLRLRAFLTTLVTPIIVRAVVDPLLVPFAQDMSMSIHSSDLWDMMGMGLEVAALTAAIPGGDSPGGGLRRRALARLPGRGRGAEGPSWIGRRGMNGAAPVVELRSVAKEFHGDAAIRNVSFDLRPSEVHSLLGENGREDPR